jgi:hypothetical protein
VNFRPPFFPGTHNALGRIQGSMKPMTRGWNGYLVRALNEFASLTVERGAIDGHRVPIRAKHQRSQNKSSSTRKKRKKITLSDSTV